jgi:hypothetical protein
VLSGGLGELAEELVRDPKLYGLVKTLRDNLTKRAMAKRITKVADFPVTLKGHHRYTTLPWQCCVSNVFEEEPKKPTDTTEFRLRKQRRPMPTSTVFLMAGPNHSHDEDRRPGQSVIRFWSHDPMKSIKCRTMTFNSDARY